MVVEVWWFLVSHIFSVILIDFYRQIFVKTGVFFTSGKFQMEFEKTKMNQRKLIWAMKRNPGWLGFIGDDTTQFYGDYSKAWQGSLLSNQ